MSDESNETSLLYSVMGGLLTSAPLLLGIEMTKHTSFGAIVAPVAGAASITTSLIVPAAVVAWLVLAGVMDFWAVRQVSKLRLDVALADDHTQKLDVDYLPKNTLFIGKHEEGGYFFCVRKLKGRGVYGGTVFFEETEAFQAAKALFERCQARQRDLATKEEATDGQKSNHKFVVLKAEEVDQNQMKSLLLSEGGLVSDYQAEATKRAFIGVAAGLAGSSVLFLLSAYFSPLLIAVVVALVSLATGLAFGADVSFLPRGLGDNLTQQRAFLPRFFSFFHGKKTPTATHAHSSHPVTSSVSLRHAPAPV